MRSDAQISASLDRLATLPAAQRKNELDKLEGLVERREVLGKPTAGQDVAGLARSAKKNPLYADRAEGQQSNWLGKAIEKIKNLRGPRMRENNMPDVNPGDISWIGQVLTILAWTVLGGLVAFFIFLIAKHVRWKNTLERKARAVLEDDEPERTLDEWLGLADEHEKAGRYREAVRCLYLACLLKFDEGGVARFDRGETNWEHLARIEHSPKLPDGIAFRAPTQHFDRVWYGHMVRGLEDVAEFRAVYIAVRDGVGRRKAA